MLKVGIVGCGNIFTMHATSCDFLPNAQLVGVCDIKKDRADKAAARYNVPAYYDYKELIEKEELEGKTLTQVHCLDEKGRVNELVRLLGGTDADEFALKHAEELLKQAKEYKRSII